MLPEELAELAREWKKRAEADREKLEQIESYARSALCRWRVLRSYFGDEKDDGRCGICDNCRRGLAEQADRPVQPLEQESSPGKVKSFEGDGTLVVGFPDGRSRKFRREFARPVNRSAQNK